MSAREGTGLGSNGPGPATSAPWGAAVRAGWLLALVHCALVPAPAFAQAGEDRASTSDEKQETSAGASRTPEELAREAERALDMFLRDQKVLFRRGEFEFEFTVVDSMDTRSNAQVGSVVVPELRFRSTTASLLARYALLDDLEINLFLPVGASERDYDFLFLNPVPELEENDITSGFGDVRAGLRYQVLRQRRGVPDMALALTYKGDTADENNGTGDQSLGVKSTFVGTIDPVVFFAEFGYDHTFENEGVDRGNEWFAQLGTGFSLNDRVSYNVQYIMRFVEQTELDGVALNASRRDIANLQFGVTTQLSRTVFLEPFLSLGLTEDATDVSVGLAMPF